MLNVIKNRYTYIVTSLIIVLFSLFMIFFEDLNLWIDMTGGTQSEYSFTNDINIDEISKNLTSLKNDFNSKNNNIINSVSVYKVSWENKIVVETWFDTKNLDQNQEKFKNDFKELVSENIIKIDSTFLLEKYINIWKSFWDYIKKTAWLTLAISLVAISIYIAFAFFWVAVWFNSNTFAIVVLITLFHDVIVASWFYIFTWMFFPEFKIDTFFITALLTILWYSVNDTIVVFDRIRYNIKTHIKTKKLDEIINDSVNETLARSIFTSLTLFFVLITIFFFGPESLKWFMLTLIYWVIFWTYSSIFVASTLLYEINKNKQLKVYEKIEVKVEDKIVV